MVVEMLHDSCLNNRFLMITESILLKLEKVSVFGRKCDNMSVIVTKCNTE